MSEKFNENTNFTVDNADEPKGVDISITSSPAKEFDSISESLSVEAVSDSFSVISSLGLNADLIHF